MRDLLLAAVTLTLSLGRLVEQSGSRRPCVRAWPLPGRDNSNRVARRDPEDVVARLDAILPRERLGERDLELARHFGHVLTLTRTISLSNGACFTSLAPPLRDAP